VISDHSVVDTASDCGREFVGALAAQDFARLARCLAADLDFHAVIPAEDPFRERSSGDETAELIGQWFGDARPLELLDSSVDEIADRVRIVYRFAAYEQETWHVVEQRAFAEVADGKIVKLDLVCSGFRPVAERPFVHA